MNYINLSLSLSQLSLTMLLLSGCESKDPLEGKFTLGQATKNLTGKGPLMAEIRTDKGSLNCELYEDKAPVTVANFVGLARGLRPWKSPQGEWVTRPAYDGTTFHRVIKGFMIQGGDASGTGKGGPGYVIPDEVWKDARHDRAGLLCMANRGPNTNGAQFFILDGPAAHLDGGYTIFGECQPASTVHAIANVPVREGRAIEPPRIEKISIRRGEG
jgi:peptidyl-prolyl cis-trans isomerase A (cyclophilin A)